MILYLSSLPKKIVEAIGEIDPDAEVNVLRTYADREEDILDIAINRPQNIKNLSLDSGTFSFNNAKTPHTDKSIDLFGDLLKKHYGKFDGGVFNFDEYFGAGGTQVNYANQLHLMSRGIPVIPVIQDIKEVDYYIENSEKYPYVAIGSGCRKDYRKGKSSKVIKDMVKRLYKAGIKVHLFAEMSYNFLKDIPVYSADAKSWLDWSTRRICCFFDEEKEKEVQLFLDLVTKRGEPNKKYYKKHPQCEAYEKWLDENFGWKITDLFLENRLTIVNAYYYCLLAKRIEAKHKELGVFD